MTRAPLHLPDPTLLLAALLAEGIRVIGPAPVQGAIAYEPLDRPEDLPKGLSDSQSPGHYRLAETAPGRWFDYVVGPQSWKKWLFPARQKLWSAERTADGFELGQPDEPWPRTAFFGVRPCEIAAMEIQDRVFDNGSFTDPGYARRRAGTLIVSVNCARAAETCFCASTATGPRAEAGYDLALTELATGTGLLLEIGSDEGARIAATLALAPATPAQIAEAKATSAATARAQTRAMPEAIAGTLKANPEHPQWEDVAARCLGCANCTLACPTCFCTDVEDVTDLSGDHAERWRSWDSCFSIDFTYVHGGAVRRSGKSRYRQWMTHKLSAWHDQFGSSGCTGCGRCIAWCPVGIDIVAEAHALSAPDPSLPAPAPHEEA
ncbi:4Fe-4S dicluster domain-containing protein [Solirhodobacter olei]|uniref:4Fe-4S dicluster domain-containing protein n=1 Tax=Solirhodobacter olei TaxID=2493082 RepID=UPI000FD861B3|nr:4Fe-4S dicluster domain-containing protein [Solirhodobacter olei]